MVSLLKNVIIFRVEERKQKIKNFWKIIILFTSKAHAWPKRGYLSSSRKKKVRAHVSLSFTWLLSLNSALSRKGMMSWELVGPVSSTWTSQIPDLATRWRNYTEESVFPLQRLPCALAFIWTTLASCLQTMHQKLAKVWWLALNLCHHGKAIWRCWLQGWDDT